MILPIKVDCMFGKFALVKISSCNCDGISKESGAETEVSRIVFQQQETKTPLDLASRDMILPLEVKVEKF